MKQFELEVRVSRAFEEAARKARNRKQNRDIVAAPTSASQTEKPAPADPSNCVFKIHCMDDGRKSLTGRHSLPPYLDEDVFGVPLLMRELKL